MKNLVILGAGTAGTMMAHKLAQRLDRASWKITIVDRDPVHYYQPGLLFIPFGVYGADDIRRPKAQYLPHTVEYIQSGIELIETDKKRVRLQHQATSLAYDILIVATGAQVYPEEVEGLMEEGWKKTAFEFYTLPGAVALAKAMRDFEGGRLLLNVVEMPIKCPVAPLEFVFLADWYFHTRGIRDKVEIAYATPLDGAFTKPRASAHLNGMLAKKNIKVHTGFHTGHVDGNKRLLTSHNGKEQNYDLLVTIPPCMGDKLIERSGIGDELNYVPTDKHTLRSKAHSDIFVIGDGTNVPTSKAGSVAHFMGEVLVENVMRHIEGRDLAPTFDGHSNCFIETGFNNALLIDFNYDTEPLPGKFPLPGVGPFSLLQESRTNHWGKMMFRWVYWNLLIKGADLPIEAQMVMAGKRVA
jgi:sulfide:quinone oxidoreductase